MPAATYTRVLLNNLAGDGLDLGTDNNGFLKVTGVPFSGDVNFDGNISQTGGVNVPALGAQLDPATYTGVIPTNSATYFLGVDGKYHAVSAANPFPVDASLTVDSMNLTDIAGDLLTDFGIGANMGLGSPALPVMAGLSAQDEATLGTPSIALTAHAGADSASNPFEALDVYLGNSPVAVEDYYNLGISTGTFLPSIASLLSGAVVNGGGFIGTSLVTVSFDGAGSPSAFMAALDINQGLWGGVAVAPAIDLSGQNVFINTTTNGPVVGAKLLAYNITDNGDELVGADFPGGANSRSAFSHALVMADIYSYNGALTGPTNPIDVQGPQTFVNTDFVATGVLTMNEAQIRQNFTINAIWDGAPTADTFTATLEGSFTGAFAGEQVVLKTLNAGNLNDALANSPWTFTRLNLSALTLVTATGVHLYAAATL